MKINKKSVKSYKIFSDIKITVRNNKNSGVAGVAYKISCKEIKFVSDFKIDHGSICLIAFHELKTDQQLFTGEIISSKTIDNAYGINKYILQFNEKLKDKNISKITNFFDLN